MPTGIASIVPGMVILGVMIILLIAAIVIIYLVKRLKATKALESSLSMVTFLVKVPKEERRSIEEQSEPMKDFRELLSGAEQFFTSLSSLYKGGMGSLMANQERICLEIVSSQGTIGFYVSCPSRHCGLVENQLHSFYPDARLEMIDNVNIFSLENGKVAAGSLRLAKRFVFPIKTYKELEVDPLNAVTNAFSKLGEEANAALQIVIEPTNQRWQIHTSMAAKNVSEGNAQFASMSTAERVMSGTFKTVGEAISSVNSNQTLSEQKMDEKDKKNARLTPQQEEMMKMLNEKGSKVGFRTNIRVISVAKSDKIAELNCDNILAAFSQYTLPQGNHFQTVKNRVSILATDYMLKTLGNAPEMMLNTQELASIFHLPNRFTDTPNILWLHSKYLAPPVNMPKEGVVIGCNVFRGETTEVRIADEDRRRHQFMIGKTGVGKTTYFENMIMQDIYSGKGLCFIDPLGDSVESILKKIPDERVDDVILFDPSDVNFPMGLNLLEYSSAEEKDFLVQECIEMFYKLFDPNHTGMVGPQFEHWFRNAALTVMSDPEGGTLIELPRLFTDDAFREEKIFQVGDPIVRAFWEQQLAKTADFHKSEMYNYFISKFGRFMTNDLMRNIIGQKKSSFNIREVMDSGKILLINLAKGKIGEINSNLLGMIMVSKIQMAAFSRADIPEESRRDFYLYVDEFQNFTTDTFATILSEARKYHLCLNITNQYISQLTEKIRDAVIGNVGTMVIYRIGAGDAEFLEKELPGVAASDMINLDRFEMYVKLLINSTPTKPFSMRGIKTDVPESQEKGEMLREIIRFKYAGDKNMISRKILGKAVLDFPDDILV